MQNWRLGSWRSSHEKLYFAACLTLALACAFLVVHEVYGPNGYVTLRRQQRQYHAAEERIHQLQQENEQVEKQVKGLKSDPNTIERVAREKMHLARPGEVIYYLPDQDSKASGASTARNRPEKR